MGITGWPCKYVNEGPIYLPVENKFQLKIKKLEVEPTRSTLEH